MDYYSSYKKTPVPRISDDKILERILALKKIAILVQMFFRLFPHSPLVLKNMEE